MADPDWIGNPPEDPYWSDDGRSIYYERQREGIGRAEEGPLPRRRLARARPARRSASIPPSAAGRTPPASATASGPARSTSFAGDIFVKDLKTGKVRQVTRTEADESEPHFLADGRRVWFRRGDDLLVYDVESGLLSQPAELKLDKDPADKKPTTYLEEQQTRLFDVIRQKQEKEKREREEERALRRADPARAPLPWYLGKEVKIETLSLSPSGDWLAVVTSPKRDESASKPSKMPQYVTESGNVETRDVRPKVGAEEPVAQSVLLLDLKNHERHDLDWTVLPGVKEDPLKALREAAEARKAAKKEDGEKKDGEKKEKKEKPAEKPKEPAPRALEVQGLSWSDDGRQLALELRARDNKDRWIATWDAAGGTLTPRHRLTDAAWINWDFNEFGWLRDNETLWLLSEESGTSQLYRLSTRTGEIRRLTRRKGNTRSRCRALSWDGRYLYYTANQEHPGKYDLWRVEVATGQGRAAHPARAAASPMGCCRPTRARCCSSAPRSPGRTRSTCRPPSPAPRRARSPGRGRRSSSPRTGRSRRSCRSPRRTARARSTRGSTRRRTSTRRASIRRRSSSMAPAICRRSPTAGRATSTSSCSAPS